MQHKVLKIRDSGLGIGLARVGLKIMVHKLKVN